MPRPIANPTPPVQIKTHAWVVAVRFNDGGIAVHGPFDGQGEASGAKDDVIRYWRDAHGRAMDVVRVVPLQGILFPRGIGKPDPEEVETPAELDDHD